MGLSIVDHSPYAIDWRSNKDHIKQLIWRKRAMSTTERIRFSMRMQGSEGESPNKHGVCSQSRAGPSRTIPSSNSIIKEHECPIIENTNMRPHIMAPNFPSPTAANRNLVNLPHLLLSPSSILVPYGSLFLQNCDNASGLNGYVIPIS